MIEATRWIQSTSGTSWQPDAFSWKNTPWLTSPSSHSRRLHCHHGSELNTIGQESQSFTQVVVNGAWTVQTATLGGGGLNLGSLSTWDGEMAIQHICREIPLFLPNGMFFLLPRMGQLRWTWPEPFQCLLKTTKEGKCEPGYLLGHLLLSYVQFYCVWGHSME